MRAGGFGVVVDGEAVRDIEEAREIFQRAREAGMEAVVRHVVTSERHAMRHAGDAQRGGTQPDEVRLDEVAGVACGLEKRDLVADGIGQNGLENEGAACGDELTAEFIGDARCLLCATRVICPELFYGDAVGVYKRDSACGKVAFVESGFPGAIGPGEDDEDRLRGVRRNGCRGA